MRRLVTLALALAAMACMGGQTSRPAVKVGNARTDQSKADATKLREALIGKPLVVQGKTLAGREFSSASLKGKVVLVDFWASWCPDCQAELPKVLETYRKYHGQGLEILGVSSDVTAGDFQDYLKGHPEVSWTELWTPPLENGRHPLNTVYGVDWIPTIFIVDKAGVCRSVKGSAEMEKLLPELLKEK